MTLRAPPSGFLFRPRLSHINAFALQRSVEIVSKKRERSKANHPPPAPPFALYGIPRPLDLAAQIKSTVGLDLPITDKTR
jgi:hypothetical protein